MLGGVAGPGAPESSLSRLMKNSYQDKARDLKRLGVISYDLRYTLSSAQKSVITKKFKEYSQFLKHPDEFHSAHVGDKTAKVLKQAGFKVTPKGRAIIPLKKYDTAQIKKGRIYFKGKEGKETTYLVGHKDFHRKLKELSERPLKRNQMITVRIGDRAPFARKFDTYAELFYYLENEFEAKDKGKTYENLLPLMSLVEIYLDKKKVVRSKRLKANYEIDPDTGEITMLDKAASNAPKKGRKGNRGN